MQNRMTAAATLAMLVTACAGPGQADPPPPSTSIAAESASTQPSLPASAVATSELVGHWIGVHDCERIVEALREAGFDEAVVLENVVGNALVPGTTSVEDLADAADPCADAVAREHGHFFTADGTFGSTDHTGQQVDVGTYEIVDKDTVSINGTEFGFAITGDALTLESLAPVGCVTFECGWSIMVAMAGEPLARGEPR